MNKYSKFIAVLMLAAASGPVEAQGFESAAADGAAVQEVAAAQFMPTMAAAVGFGSLVDQTYAVGEAVALTLPQTTASGLDYALVGPDGSAAANLPDGWAYAAASRVLSGAATAPAVAALTYIASMGGAEVERAEFTVTIIAPYFSYFAVGDKSYRRTSTISPITLPAVIGGFAPLRYTVTGPDGQALAAAVPGLVFDADARVLSGTLSTVAAATTLTYAMVDSRDNATDNMATFKLSVGVEFLDPFEAQTYVAGVAAVTVLPQIGGGILGRHELTGAVPAGMSFSGGLILSGTPSVAAAAVALTYRVYNHSSGALAGVMEFMVTVLHGLPAVQDASFALGERVALNLPAAIGGGDLAYTLVGPDGAAAAANLPPGLSFTAGRVLAGKPTTVAAAVTLTYAASLLGGGEVATTEFSVTITSGVTFADFNVADKVYAVGVAIAPLTLPPAVGGASPLGYALTGRDGQPLAAAAPGLVFDGAADSRVLTGIPTAVAAATTLTYLATDAMGAATDGAAVFKVAVGRAFAAAIDEVQFAAGDAVSLTLPRLAGGAPRYALVGPGGSAVEPKLPPGLGFDASARVLSGTPTEAGATLLTYIASEAAVAVAIATFQATVTAPAFAAAALVRAQRYTRDVAIAALTLPPAIGAAPLTYALTAAGQAIGDAVPGLAFDAASRVLSGTPNTMNLRGARLTYSASDRYGNALAMALTFRLYVGAFLVADQEFALGNTITPLTLPATAAAGVHAYTLTSDRDSNLMGSLPAGMTYTAATRVLSGRLERIVIDTSPALTYAAVRANGAVVVATTFEARLVKSVFLPSPIGAGATPNTDVLTLYYPINQQITPFELPTYVGQVDAGQETRVAYTGFNFRASGVRIGRSIPPTLTGTPSLAGTFGVGNSRVGPALYGVYYGNGLFDLIHRDGPPRAGQKRPDLVTVDITVCESGGHVSGLVPCDAPAFTPLSHAVLDDVILVKDMALPSSGFVLPKMASGGTGLVPSLSYTLSPDSWLRLTAALGVTYNGDLAFALSGTPSVIGRVTIADLTVTDLGSRILLVIPPFDVVVVEAQAATADQNYFLAAAVNLTLPALITHGGGEQNGANYALAVAGGLPAGLEFEAASRVLSGTPRAPVDRLAAVYTATAADGVAHTDNFTISVAGAAFAAADLPLRNRDFSRHASIGEITLPGVLGGGSFSYSLTGAGGQALNVAVPGLTFDGTIGGARVLSGRPTRATDAVALTYIGVDGADNATAEATFTVSVRDGVVFPATAGVGATPNTAVINLYYRAQSAITALQLPLALGIPPAEQGNFTYQIVDADGVSQARVRGLEVFAEPFGATPAVVLSGTPTALGVSALTYRLSENDAASGTSRVLGALEFNLTVCAADNAVADNSSGAVVCASELAFSAIGDISQPFGRPVLEVLRPIQNAAGAEEFGFAYDLWGEGGSMAAPMLPRGLAFSATTRTLEGMAAAGSYPLTYTASRNGSEFDRAEFTLTISHVLAAIADMSFAVNAEVALTLPVIAGGGGDGFTYALFAAGDSASAPNLPPGLSFTAAERVLGGVPSAAAALTLTYTATAAGTLYSSEFTVTITGQRFAAVNRIIVPRVGRAMSASAVFAITSRIHRAGRHTSSRPQFALGDQTSLAGMLAAHGQAMAKDERKAKELLAGTAFTLPLNAAGRHDGAAIIAATPHAVGFSAESGRFGEFGGANSPSVGWPNGGAASPSVDSPNGDSGKGGVHVAGAVDGAASPSVDAPNGGAGKGANIANIAAPAFALSAKKPAVAHFPVAFWGSGAYRKMSGVSRGLNWDGELRGFHIGVDARLRAELLAGLALSKMRSEIDYRDAGGGLGGAHAIDMTSLYPYLGWRAGPLDLWATIGYGRGELAITPTGGAKAVSDIDLAAAAIGASGELWQHGATTMRLRGEAIRHAMKVAGSADLAAMQTASTRLRLAMEASHRHTLSGGGAVTPLFEAGLRHAAGDGKSGGSAEIGFGLGYHNPATRFTADGRLRLADLFGGYQEWGLQGTLARPPGADGQGWSFALAPTYGQADTGLEQIWRDRSPVAATAATATAATDPDPATDYRMRAEVRLGYGMALKNADGILTPYGEMTIGAAPSHRIGLNWRLIPNFDLNLLAERRAPAATSSANSILLKGEAQF